MPWNGSGTFTLNQNFPADRDAGAPDHFIQADDFDDELTNIKTGLQNCMTLTGETTPAANIPMNAKRITGLADAAAATDAVNRQFADARFVALAGSTLTGALLVDSGTVALPGLAFDVEPDCGLYYIGANNIGVTIAGAKVLDVSASGLDVVGEITSDTDPSTAAGIGDRGYNDARYAQLSNNLSDVTAATARTNLGLGSIATQASSSVTITGGSITGITDLAVANGGTGASTAANARTNLGIGSNATRAFTASTSAPSGGSDGDVWYRYV